jgi:hypothetical protein
MRLLRAVLHKKDIEGNRAGEITLRLEDAELREFKALILKEIKTGMRPIYAVKFLIEMYEKLDQGQAVMRDMKTTSDQRRDSSTQYMTWRYRP